MAFKRLYDNFSGRGSNKGIMGDFAHAAALYRRNNYRLAPKNKFLYHVVIDVNTTALATLGRSVSGLLNQREFNLLASSADLPTYTINTETLNQYNRKKVIQTKLNYNPINIEFHDDNAGITTLLWEAYYRYYYQDGNYDTNPRAYKTKLYDTDNANTYRHGFNRRRSTDAPFFNSITIHQLHPQDVESTFTSFTIVNPLIQEWTHDRVDQTDGAGIMKNSMRIEYEAVIYDRGRTSAESISSYGDVSHYDTTDSPYTSTTSNGLDSRQGDIGFWLELFGDLLSNPITLTDFNSQQRQDNLPISTQPILSVVQQSPTTVYYTPSSNNQSNFTSATQVNSNATSNLTNQELKRQIQNNPQRLADFAAGTAQLAVGINSGLSIQESKTFYNNLSPNIKSQVEQSALNNFNEIAAVGGNSIGFQNDLREIGLI